MTKQNALLALLLGCLPSMLIRAQCSDAGVCAIGGGHAEPQHVIGLSYIYGRTSAGGGLHHHVVQAEGSFQISATTRLSILIPWSSQSGPRGSASGIGDILVLADQVFSESPSDQWSIQVGAKLATADVNAGGLPQAYQSGLGTNDLLFGVSYSANPWLLAAGYQLSRGRSENSVDRLKRGDDFLLRVGYAKPFGTAETSLDLLAIQRLRKSSVLVRGFAEDRFVDLENTDRLQINVLGRIAFPASATVDFEATGAIPLLQRPSNVDGLKRGITLSAGVKYRF